MLGIKNHPFALAFEEGDGVADHGEILLLRGFEDIPDVEIPAFAKDGHRTGIRRQQGLDVGVLLHRYPLAAGGAESHQPGMLQLQFARAAEKLQILGIGAGISRLDEGDSQCIQQTGHRQLILHGEADSFALGAVP